MAAKYNTFRVALLPGVAHSKKTKEIFNSLEGSKSEFVREAILKFAQNLGFQSNGNGDEKPEYLTDEQWELFKQKSLIGRLDYQYYIAFYYLKSLTNFRTVTSGKLVRRAMKEHELT
jgi:hypothetical protein